MRILVDFSDYRCGNMGDLAMLKVTVSRLKDLWPAATIQVPVFTPQLLTAHCPEVEPVAYEARRLWFKDRFLLGRLLDYSPDFISTGLVGLARGFRLKCPSVVGSLIDLKMRLRRQDNTDFRAFHEALLGADLVAVCGQGGLTDTFRRDSFAVLDFLEMATALGKPTVMFGQGLGPMTDPDLVERARSVLPAVDFIALREGRAGEPLLASLGVSPENFSTTGDDAIEMAYDARSEKPGSRIGVNVRAAGHAKVDLSDVDRIRPVLHKFAGARRTDLLPLPISRHENFRDQNTIRHLLAGYDDASDGGRDLDTPLKLIRQVARCRIVVTGAYHAAVFALSQGIPVVGLGRSEYCMNKFAGLRDLFGSACDIVRLDGDNLSERLTAAIDRAWDSAEAVRPGLLESARRQIAAGREAYRNVYERVSWKSAAA